MFQRNQTASLLVIKIIYISILNTLISILPQQTVTTFKYSSKSVQVRLIVTFTITIHKKTLLRYQWCSTHLCL